MGSLTLGTAPFSCWCRARLRVWLCWWMLWSKLRYALYLRVGCVGRLVQWVVKVEGWIEVYVLRLGISLSLC